MDDPAFRVMRAANESLQRELSEARERLEGFEALKEQHHAAAVSFDLARKRLLTRIENANVRLNQAQVEGAALRTLLRTIVVTRSVRDFRTKRNLIAVVSKVADMSLHTLEQLGLLVPAASHTLQSWVVSVEENENSCDGGRQIAMSTTASGARPGTSGVAGDPTNDHLLRAKQKASDEMTLIRARKRSALSSLISRKATLSHPALLEAVEVELVRLGKMLAQALGALRGQVDVVRVLSERNGELVDEVRSSRERLGALEEAHAELQALHARSAAVSLEREQAREVSSLVAGVEEARRSNALRALQGDIARAQKTKASLDRDIARRHELQLELQRANGSLQELQEHLAERQAMQPVFPHYAALDEKDDDPNSSRGMVRPVRRADSGPMVQRASLPGATHSAQSGESAASYASPRLNSAADAQLLSPRSPVLPQLSPGGRSSKQTASPQRPTAATAATNAMSHRDRAAATEPASRLHAQMAAAAAAHGATQVTSSKARRRAAP